MAYSLLWREEAVEDIARFSDKHRRMFVRKVRLVVDNLPQSLRLRSVQPVRGAEDLGLPGRLYELDVGSGFRVAIMVNEEQQTAIVYLAGDHDYCKANYLKAADRRLKD